VCRPRPLGLEADEEMCKATSRGRRSEKVELLFSQVVRRNTAGTDIACS